MSEDQLEALVEGYENSPLFTDREKAAIRWAEALTQFEAKHDDAAFARLKEHFSDAEIVELTLASGIFNFFNRFTDPMHIPLEAGAKDVTLLLRGRQTQSPEESRAT